jgi:large subunit ribosomal protein L10
MAEHKVQQYKVEAVERLKGWFKENPDLIFSDFRGLTFPQMIGLREKLAGQKTAYRVVRNAFAKIALKESGLPDASAMLEGPTALAFLGADPGPSAKVIVDFTKGSPLKVKGGIIGGRLTSVAEVEALSRLPSRAELLGQLLGTMNAPLMHLMYAMNGVASKLVRTLAAVADQKQKAAAA